MVATKSGSIEVASMAPPIYDAAGIDCERFQFLIGSA